MIAKYHAFKLDCLRKGAIQQTDSAVEIHMSFIPSFVCESGRQSGERYRRL